MDRMTGTMKKFWCLEGFVAIIFTIFTANALLSGSYLWGILMAIFSYWWIKRVLARPTSYKRSKTDYHGDREIDL